jgi:hypothetical protein
MAQVGTGYRSVISMMLELSFHLLEPWLITTTSSAVIAQGTATVQLGTLGYPVSACYVGAQLVIDTGLPQEIITLTAVDPTSTPPTITATFANPHASGVQVWGATFPTQANSGDPFFTQSEILSYIARAQSQFLADVPLIFALNSQNVTVGQILQPLVCDAIEIHRIASSSPNVALSSLSRLNGTVTATSISPHGLTVNEQFAIIQAPDPNWDGAFTVASVPNNLTWTYQQGGPNESIGQGGWAGLWVRLLEVSAEELSMQDPFYRNNFVTRLTSFYEDRVGLYQFGVNGKPSTNLPVEVLCSIRDSDILQLTDYFLTPDPFLHYVKYLALSYAFSKDGEARDAAREKYCRERYLRGVLVSKRWMSGHGVGLSSGAKVGGPLATAG